ncbi:hypothetical protein PAL_GLEAN10003494 [Pteropus alecto]|uniref:Uncharacterized protein n=1 Tax=Pteropus alecto TaxID=9402 RepID=L5JWJ2_PTEAL|nr:hypothetical protein PAL_GLEAN10003494 [Pteropus alecto]
MQIHMSLEMESPKPPNLNTLMTKARHTLGDPNKSPLGTSQELLILQKGGGPAPLEAANTMHLSETRESNRYREERKLSAGSGELAEIPQTPQNAKNTELEGTLLPHDTHPGHSSSVVQLCFQLLQQQF